MFDKVDARLTALGHRISALGSEFTFKPQVLVAVGSVCVVLLPRLRSLMSFMLS